MIINAKGLLVMVKINRYIVFCLFLPFLEEIASFLLKITTPISLIGKAGYF